LLAATLHPLPARRRAFSAQVEAECRAQIRAVRALCGSRPLAAVDGHNHVHMIPAIFAAVVRAAAAEGVPEVRVSREVFHVAEPRDLLRPGWWKNVVKHALLRLFSLRAASRLGRAGLSAPDRLVGVLYTGEMTAARAQRGIAAARAARAATLEVLFHVGRSTAEEVGRWAGDDPLYSAFHLSAARDREREALLALAPQLSAERGAIRPGLD
jgi:hypothetical protein